jgi:hypothetical protein
MFEQFRAPLGTVMDCSDYGINISQNCQVQTKRRTGCSNSAKRVFINAETGEKIYTCNMKGHRESVDLCLNAYVIFARVRSNSIKLEQRKFGPDKYIEFAYDEYVKYDKIEKSNLRFLDHADARAQLLDDIDGSYPITIERCLSKIALGIPGLGFDMYHSWLNYERIVYRLRGEYIKRLNIYNEFVRTRSDAVEYYIKIDKLELEYICGHDSECAICFENVCKETGGHVKDCKHAFHNTCLQKWLNVNKSCPNCRKSLNKPLFML